MERPGYGPEILADAAPQILGGPAQEWARQMRRRYPHAPADGLARLATRRYVRLAAAGGAASTVTGLLAPVAELATAFWAQASLTLRLAAAYGHDATAAERAVDLLVLLGAYPDDESARAALLAARAAPERDDLPLGDLWAAGRRLSAPLAAQAGGWLAARLVARLVPGAATLTAAAANSEITQRLAARAASRFRPPAPRRGHSQSNQSRGNSA